MSTQLGDPTEWVDRFGDGLLRFAAARVSNRESAEDLVQETFLAAFRHRAQFDGKSTLGTWLVSILRRKIADHYRQLGRPVASLDSAAGSESIDVFSKNGKWRQVPAKWAAIPEGAAEAREFWQVLESCLGTIPGHLAQAFQMRELSTLPIDDVTKVTGITPEHLAVRLHRARLLLRQCLEKKWFRIDRGERS